MIKTIGHSNMNIEEFINIIKNYNVNIIADVRSVPYSKYVPHFNREDLRNILNKNNIKYIFLGDKLGARWKEPDAITNNKADFEKIKKIQIFKKGIEELIKLSENNNTAIMCSEKNPLDCHRFELISPVLKEKNIVIEHILDQTNIKSQEYIENKLINKYKDKIPELFIQNDEDMLKSAYEYLNQDIGYIVK